MYYALSTDDPDSGYHIFGKGDDAAQAETNAAEHIHSGIEDAALLRQNLIILSREEAEERDIVQRGAPVIWYDRLGRYRVEDHGPYRPLTIEKRIQTILQ